MQGMESRLLGHPASILDTVVTELSVILRVVQISVQLLKTRPHNDLLFRSDHMPNWLAVSQVRG